MDRHKPTQCVPSTLGIWMFCVLQHGTEAMTQAEAEAGVVVGVEGMAHISL